MSEKSNAKTQLVDIIEPKYYAQYVLALSSELSELWKSGIVRRAPEFDALAGLGGNLVEMPYWNDLSGDRQPLSDSGELTTSKITASRDTARIHNDGAVWSWNLLAELVSGSDPMGAIATRLGNYWARENQKLVLSSLKGIFAAASMAGNLLAVHSESVAGQSATTRLHGSTFVDATQKLGDHGEDLVAVAMHSAVEAALRKLDLIDFLPDSEGKLRLKSFQGRRVIVDDACPVRAGTTDGQVYTTYLFGYGAFASGFADLSGRPVEGGHGTEAFELHRNAMASDTSIINRRRFILHPRGVRWTNASVAAANPTNAEIETGANWVRVWDAKRIRIVAITHNI